MGRKNDKDISRSFSTAMLILSSINDIADDALRDAVDMIVADERMGRVCVAHALNAKKMSADVEKRTNIFLEKKKVLQEVIDYKDARSEQTRKHLLILRLSIKHVIDNANVPDGNMLSYTSLADVMLAIAARTYKRIIEMFRKAYHTDFSRVIHGMSMYEVYRFYKMALRTSKIKVGRDLSSAIGSDNHVKMACDALRNALFDSNAMKDAEAYAVSFKI